MQQEGGGPGEVMLWQDLGSMGCQGGRGEGISGFGAGRGPAKWVGDPGKNLETKKGRLGVRETRR